MLRGWARLQRRGRPGLSPGSLFIGSPTGLPTTNARFQPHATIAFDQAAVKRLRKKLAQRQILNHKGHKEYFVIFVNFVVN
jgi:hypothetical protein